MKSDRYQELDALRGIAALAVVLFHYTVLRPESPIKFSIGVTGVDLFFMISGFVIYMSLKKVKSVTEFAINRVSRLYPSYWFCVTVAFAFILFRSTLYRGPNYHATTLVDYLSNLTMFQYYFNEVDLDGPYWTMLIEMLFYILMGLLFYYKLLKRINIIGPAITITTVALTLFFHQTAFVKGLLHFAPILISAPLFFAGIVFYQVHENKQNLIKQYATLALYLICQLLLFKYDFRSYSHVSQFEYTLMVTAYFTALTLFVHGKLKFIVSKTTLFFGRISYPLYLFHQFISTNFVIPALTLRLHVNYYVATFVIAFPLVVGCAYLISRFIEYPFNKIMRRKLNSLLIKS